MARGDVSITVVPTTSANGDSEVNIIQDTTLLAQYINDNRPASHDVIEVDFRGPRPIVIYRQHA
tara:strand:+ start:627 stop:818 length:192 start_codon:yes stop_codon:yes gene_type:complete